MSETLVVVCDRCGRRVGKAERVKIRWGSQPSRREPNDLCGDCRGALTEWLDHRPTNATAPTPRVRVGR